jgi:hypothetical protein
MTHRPSHSPTPGCGSCEPRHERDPSKPTLHTSYVELWHRLGIALLIFTATLALLAAAAIALLTLLRSVVLTLLAAGAISAAAGLLGAPIPH